MKINIVIDISPPIPYLAKFFTKFAISLQYVEEEVSDKVDFLNANKHESFLQNDTMIFDRNDQAFPKFPK